LKYLWLAVTPDEYELPLCVADSARQLAEELGITCVNVLASEARGISGKITGRKIVKVKFKEDVGDEN